MENITELYISGISGPNIAKLFNIPIWKVYEELKKSNIDRRSNKLNSRRYIVDDSYFENIDNNHKAYWLGFLFADGHVVARDSIMSVSCGKKDVGHLEKLKEDLKSNYPIRTYLADTKYGLIEYDRFKVVSSVIVNDLISSGCLPNKSLILEPPLRIPVSLERDFIRGYTDGDGSITIANKRETPKISMVGTLELLGWIKDRLPGVGYIYPDTRKPYIYQYSSVGKHALSNIGWLYTDATVYLERKNKRAMELLAAL